MAAKWVSLANVFTPSGGGLLAATERLFQRVIWSAHNQCTSLASIRSNAVWCIRQVGCLVRWIRCVRVSYGEIGCRRSLESTSERWQCWQKQACMLALSVEWQLTSCGVSLSPFRFIAERRNDFRPQPKVVRKFVADLRPNPKDHQNSTLVFFRRRSRTSVGLYLQL